MDNLENVDSCAHDGCNVEMGNTSTSHFEDNSADSWWSQQNASNSTASSSTQENERQQEKKQKLEEVKTNIAELAERRKHIVEEKSIEINKLKLELEQLKKENERLRNNRSLEFRSENDRSFCEQTCVENNVRTIPEVVNDILETNIENSENTKNFEKERQEYKSLIAAQKEVILVYKQMLKLKETQLSELNTKLGSIEKLIAKEKMQRDLRSEYEKQLVNIRNLKVLYEEKQRAQKKEKEELVSYLDTVKKELEAEQKRNKDNEERILELEKSESQKYDEIKHLESDLGLTKAESRQLEAELTIINQLFSDVLLGYNSTQDVNLDKLQRYLEEHHGFLQDIANNDESSEDLSAMPKMLLELCQIEENKRTDEEKELSADNFEGSFESSKTITDTSEETSENCPQISSPEQIVKNLPKVWRILIELLSHQVPPVNDIDENNENLCYKTVQTPKGPSLVLSVSQTYIRLKDLILEKKSLEKETNKLKLLNCHLENRLQEQEKRLELVQGEVSKTWHVVGKIQKQHQLIQTQEKVLRYELAQKRKLLAELKEELESSRAKWAQAREKNSSTEQQWKQLRSEFASRKTRVKVNFNDSAESGFSDENEKECSSDSCDEQACDTAD